MLSSAIAGATGRVAPATKPCQRSAPLINNPRAASIPTPPKHQKPQNPRKNGHFPPPPRPAPPRPEPRLLDTTYPPLTPEPRISPIFYFFTQTPSPPPLYSSYTLEHRYTMIFAHKVLPTH